MKRQTILTLILLQSLFISTSAQPPTPTPGAPQKPETTIARDDVVRITSNLVQIDAVVTDRKGKAVAGLGTEDFEIYEDGRPQRITNFSFIARDEVGVSTNALAAKKSDRATTTVNPVPTIRLRPEQIRRTFALVVDDLGLSFESMHYVRAALRKFVDEQIQPGDLVAIIRTGAGVGALQQFTSDKRLLYAAIERVKWNSRGRSGIAAFSPIQDSPLDTFNKMPQGDGSPAPLNPGTKTDLEKDVRQRQSDFSDQIFSV